MVKTVIILALVALFAILLFSNMAFIAMGALFSLIAFIVVYGRD